MTRDDVLRQFRETGALLEGHFLLTSGLHSAVYLQCAKVLMHPARAEAPTCMFATSIGAGMDSGTGRAIAEIRPIGRAMIIRATRWLSQN